MSEAKPFEIVSAFKPMGDQPRAIREVATRIRKGEQHSCLLGATGTGKTFTMANVIAELGKPALIISHNKTLAAQLFEELRSFFPNNSVNYFVSYYDYYQPEAYIPARDIYIEKDSSRNDDLDQLRLAATSSLLSRRDSIVVASVSCIFGLGSPLAYAQKVLTITRGSEITRRDFFLALTAMQYQRSEIEWKRGCFRAHGDTIDIWPAYERFAVRIELFGDEIERIELINPTSGELLAEEKRFFLFPAVHYVMPEDQLDVALAGIRAELDEQVIRLRSQGKLLEAQRLLARTKYDLEMIAEVGFCSGIENYSLYMDGRQPGERPYTLLDYFDFAPPDPGRQDAPSQGEHARRLSERLAQGPLTPEATADLRANRNDWLVIIDESHVTLPQIRAMYNGDRARKEVLVEHGFRLPSALDNRPLRFEEFESIVPQVVYVSATPGPYELDKCGGVVAEQVIRPTGLLDPTVQVLPARNQVAQVLERCRERAERGDRVLVTALTKRLCEDLTEYFDKQGLKVRYLHSDIDTLERVEILTELREGVFDVLVGVNLLREGLDLPEVSLVCILDADKEGFLRSTTSLIQQMGRAARNAGAHVLMFADKVTPAMKAAIEETERRRAKQMAYNAERGITPETIQKEIRRGIETELKARKQARGAIESDEPALDAEILVRELDTEMREAAASLEFEKAARARDLLAMVRELLTQAEAEDGPLMLRRSDLEPNAKPKRTRRGKRQTGANGRPGKR